MGDPVEMQERYEAVMMRQLKEHGIFEGVVAMFNAKQAEIERLREALGFYADKRNWRETFGHANVNVDWGNIARAALGEEKK